MSKDQDIAIIAMIRRQLSLNVSLCTIRRRLAQAGLRNRIACQRPRLSHREKETRLVFAEDHMSWKEEDWSQVVFSDESTFEQSRDHLWSVVQEEWERLWQTPDLVKNLYRSLPGRVLDVVEAKGSFRRH
ncbi:hypothetical protein HPB48_013248 [Haemaphysalis longicornis]|uniref:Transposase Tc1-like domain-containing protein n=1 Tax=Haemaphysalis longicornis TaxID=44386 RepID=A0A9J6GZA9_HAELO|nr:hypothetical protein HPB48_013248 [Haemaphysalis longicornis]